MGIFATFVDILCTVLAFAVFARAIVSWFPVNPGNRLVAFLYQITEPILAPLRRVVSPIGGTVDITPMIAFLILMAIARII